MQVLNWLYGVRYPRSSPPMQPVVFPRGEIKVRKPTCAEVEALDDHHFHGYRRGKLVCVTLVLESPLIADWHYSVRAQPLELLRWQYKSCSV